MGMGEIIQEPSWANESLQDSAGFSRSAKRGGEGAREIRHECRLLGGVHKKYRE